MAEGSARTLLTASLLRILSTSHRKISPLSDPEARMLPSGEKTTESTSPPDDSQDTLGLVFPPPESVDSSRPVATSHNLIVSSHEPEARTLPSGEKATDVTSSVCPVRVHNSLPVDTSHRLIVSSQAPEARSAPSGEKATELMLLLNKSVSISAYQVSVCNSSPVITSHSLILYDVHETRVFPKDHV